jgi:phage gp29-like protein
MRAPWWPCYNSGTGAGSCTGQPERIEKMQQHLIDKVLEQIVRDVESGDLTAIEELIADIPADKAVHFLSEQLQGDAK